MTGIALCKPPLLSLPSAALVAVALVGLPTTTDARPRSTFLKRKGGLFKKAHELSVLCSVDVAVFIFGSNKKLYEYSSGDMRELITRYQYVSVAHARSSPPLSTRRNSR